MLLTDLVWPSDTEASPSDMAQQGVTRCWKDPWKCTLSHPSSYPPQTLDRRNTTVDTGYLVRLAGNQNGRQAALEHKSSDLVSLPPPDSGSNDMYTCQMEPKDQGQGTPHRIKVFHRGMWLKATTPDLAGLPLGFRRTGLITRHQGSVVAFSANVETQNLSKDAGICRNGRVILASTCTQACVRRHLRK